MNAITASTSQAALAANTPDVIWSRITTVRDVRDGAEVLSGVRRGCGYLPLSITETEVSDAGAARARPGFSSVVESWTVLGDDQVPVAPVERFLAYLSSIERSPNTVKAYAHDLKDWFTFLAVRGLDWRSVTVEDVAGYVAWLRLPPAARDGRVQVLPTVEHHCSEASVNRMANEHSDLRSTRSWTSACSTASTTAALRFRSGRTNASWAVSIPLVLIDSLVG